MSCKITDNFCFYLQNRLTQTSQTGGQCYSYTSPFSITCLKYETRVEVTHKEFKHRSFNQNHKYRYPDDARISKKSQVQYHDDTGISTSLMITNAEYCYAECHYVECHYAKCPCSKSR